MRERSDANSRYEVRHCDVIPNTVLFGDWYVSPLERAKIVGSAALLAIGVFILIPLVKWITMPTRDDIGRGCITAPVIIPPPKVYVSPPPKPKDEPKAAEEPIKFLPTIDDLIYTMLPMDTGGISIPSWTMEQVNLESIDDILNLDEVDKIPEPLSQVAPNYPYQLKSQRVSDRVIVQFVVDEMGNVKHPTIKRGGHSLLNQSSLEAIRKWKFKPGEKAGRPVQVRMLQPFDFKVN